MIDRAGTWDNWLPAWSAEGERHAALADQALAAGHRLTAGEGLARASLFYHFGQFMAFDDLDAKAAAAARKVALFRRALKSADQAIAAAPIWHAQHRVLSEVIGGLKKSLGQLRPGRGGCPA